MENNTSIIDHQFPLTLQPFISDEAPNFSFENKKSSIIKERDSLQKFQDNVKSISPIHPTSSENNTLPTESKNTNDEDEKMKRYLKESQENFDGIIDQLDILMACLKISGLSDESVNDFIVDTLTSIIKKYYDSKHVQQVFFHYFEHQPKFLSNLLHDKKFRRVVYELSEKYSNCHFLSWMIRWVAEDEQYRAELKAVASDATTQYDVFQKAFLDSLLRIISFGDERDINSPVMKDFFNLCSHTEYTYLYSICILRNLSRKTKSERIRSHFRRVTDELEQFAVSSGRTSDVLLRRMLIMIDENYWLEMDSTANTPFGSRMNRFSEVSGSIVNILSGNLTNSDIIKLYNSYPPTGKDWPPIEFLRNADLFEKLLHDIFRPGSNKSKADRGKYIHLLTVATCDNPLNQESFQSLYKAFIETVEVCSNKSSARDLIPSVRKLREFTKYNSICMGIMMWIQNVFEDPESFGTTEMNNARIYLSLIEEIAFHHRSVRPAVLNLAKRLLCRKQRKDASQAIELQKLFTHIIIFVMRLGHVLEAIYCIREIVDSVDMAIIRHIIQQVLLTVAPPYSDEFLYQICKTLCIPRVRHALSNQDKIVSSVTSFVDFAFQSQELRNRLDSEGLNPLEAFKF